jgi:hypothetical protein
MAGDVGGWPPELAHDAFVAGGGIAGPAERLLRLYWKAFGGGPPASEQEQEEYEDEDEDEDEAAEAAAAAARQAALERALAAAALEDEDDEEEKEARRVAAFLEQLRLLSGPWAGVVYDESTGRVLAARGPESEEQRQQQPLYWGVAPAPSGGRVLMIGTDPSDLAACSPPAEPFPAGALYHWRGGGGAAGGVPAAAAPAAATVASPPKPPRRRPEMARPGQSQPGESGFVLSPSRRGARPLPLPDEAFGALRPLSAATAPSGGATAVVRSEPVLDPETGAVVGCVFRVVTTTGGEGEEEEGGSRAAPFDPRKLRPLAVGGGAGAEDEEDEEGEEFATPLPGSPAAEAAKRRESKTQRRRRQRARAEAKARREREKAGAAAAEALPAA